MKHVSLVFIVLIALLGCDDGTDMVGGVESTYYALESETDSKPNAAPDEYGAAYDSGYGGDSTESAVEQVAPVERKLIYTSTVSLAVADFDAAVEDLRRWTAQSNGYIASNRMRSQVANARSGTWVIRVPSTGYNATVDYLRRLGEVKSLTESTDDVTEEFVDVEARLANARKLEERIVDLLEDRSGKLADILEIERELARIRETIERIEG